MVSFRDVVKVEDNNNNASDRRGCGEDESQWLDRFQTRSGKTKLENLNDNKLKQAKLNWKIQIIRTFYIESCIISLEKFDNNILKTSNGIKQN